MSRALGPVEIVSRLAGLQGWVLGGDGDEAAIVKTFRFGDFKDTMAFVNAVAWIAHQGNHHPDLSVHYNRCVVRYRTHDAGGISLLDFEHAARVDALLAPE